MYTNYHLSFNIELSQDIDNGELKNYIEKIKTQCCSYKDVQGIHLVDVCCTFKTYVTFVIVVDAVSENHAETIFRNISLNIHSRLRWQKGTIQSFLSDPYCDVCIIDEDSLPA